MWHAHLARESRAGRPCHSRNQSQLFSHLHRLGSSSGAQLVEQAAGMGLDGVFADKEFFGDLAIAQAVGNQLEDLTMTVSLFLVSLSPSQIPSTAKSSAISPP